MCTIHEWPLAIRVLGEKGLHILNNCCSVISHGIMSGNIAR
jgi:hypothetical protein